MGGWSAVLLGCMAMLGAGCDDSSTNFHPEEPTSDTAQPEDVSADGEPDAVVPDVAGDSTDSTPPDTTRDSPGVPCRLPFGGSCAPGEVCPAGDGCNLCLCRYDGTVACTWQTCADAGSDASPTDDVRWDTSPSDVLWTWDASPGDALPWDGSTGDARPWDSSSDASGPRCTSTADCPAVWMQT